MKVIATPFLITTPLLALALAACGGSPSSPRVASANAGSTSSPSPSASTSHGDPLKFAACMRQHGVKMADPVGGRTTVRAGKGDGPKLEAAQNACRQYAPGIGGAGGGPGVTKQDQERFLHFAQCMRQHGVPMADPDFSGGGVRIEIRGPKQSDSGKLNAAQQACAKLIPQPKGGPGPQSGQTGSGSGKGQSAQGASQGAGQ
jgi:hypothetical protein